VWCGADEQNSPEIRRDVHQTHAAGGNSQAEDGDIARIDDLVREAQEGAFDVRHCGGEYRCEIIRDILQQKLSQAAFHEMVSTVARNCDTSAEFSNRHLREAARAFWKALALG
jgi:hypothetical protein